MKQLIQSFTNFPVLKGVKWLQLNIQEISKTVCIGFIWNEFF